MEVGRAKVAGALGADCARSGTGRGLFYVVTKSIEVCWCRVPTVAESGCRTWRTAAEMPGAYQTEEISCTNRSGRIAVGCIVHGGRVLAWGRQFGAACRQRPRAPCRAAPPRHASTAVALAARDCPSFAELGFSVCPRRADGLKSRVKRRRAWAVSAAAFLLYQ